jgi:peptidoglycan/LPS O-acetylase OafA/YrhL
MEVALSDESRSPTIDYLRAFSILWVLAYHFVPLRIFNKGTDGVLLFLMAYTWVALPTLNPLHIGYHWPDLAYWSLEIEFHFYALVFVAMLIGLRRHLLLAVCGYVFTKVCLLQGLQTNFAFYPFFIAGLSVASLNAGRSLPGWFGISLSSRLIRSGRS